jgi:hypothetical protein
MTNEPAKSSRHNKFQFILGAGAACLVTGALISFTLIGLPLGIPLILVGVVLLAISPAFKAKQMVRSRQNHPERNE